jgi:hypothetical protein
MATMKRYAVTYVPKKKAFAVNKLEKGMEVKSKYKRDTTIVRSTSPTAALKKLSRKSYMGETGKKLVKKK